MAFEYSQVTHLLSFSGAPGSFGLPEMFMLAGLLLVGLLLLFGLATLAGRFFRQSVDVVFEVLLLGVLLLAIVWYFFTPHAGYF